MLKRILRRAGKVAFYVILVIFAIDISHSLIYNNERTIHLESCADADKVAMQELVRLLEQNYLRHETFEVFVRCNDNPFCIANYNLKYGVLWIQTDPGSGWMPPLKVSEMRLRQLAKAGYQFPDIFSTEPPMSQELANASYPY